MAEAFGHVMQKVSRNKNLSAGAKGLYCYLASFADSETGECFPKLATILEEMAISENTFYKYLKELEKENVVERKQRKMKTTIYKILNHIVPKKQRTSNIEEHKTAKFEDYNKRTYNNNNNYNYCRSYKKHDNQLSTTTKQIIDFLNKTAGTRYKVTTVIQDKIQQLLTHGYSLNDIKQVIRVKVTQFKDKRKFFMTKPNILFDLNRFDDLLQESMSNIMPYTTSTVSISQEKKVIVPEWETEEYKAQQASKPVLSEEEIKRNEQMMRQQLNQMLKNLK